MAGRSMSSGGGFVNPDSVLAQTARELVRAHSDDGGQCRCCGGPVPCSPARAAAQVLAAAGVAPSQLVATPTRPGAPATAWEAPPRAADTVVFNRGQEIPYPAGASPAA